MNWDSLSSLLTATRLVDGQVAYRDVMIPTGPLPEWILALLIWLTGSPALAMGLATALLVAAMFWSVYVLVYRSTDSRSDSLAAALLAALWFAVYGSFYRDHLAWALCLGGAAIYFGGKRSLWRIFLSSVVVGFAFHAKQPLGLLGTAAFVVAVLIDSWDELEGDVFVGAAGYGLTMCAVLVVIALLGGDLNEWQRSVIEAPAAYAKLLPTRGPEQVALGLLFPFKLCPWDVVGWGRAAFYPVALGTLIAGLAAIRRRDAPMIFLWLSTCWCAAYSGRAFAEVAFGAPALLVWLVATRPAWVRATVAGSLALLAVVHIHVLVPQRRAYLGAAEQAVVDYLRDRPGKLARLWDVPETIPLALGRVTHEPWSLYVRGLTPEPDFARLDTKFLIMVGGETPHGFELAMRAPPYAVLVWR